MRWLSKQLPEHRAAAGNARHDRPKRELENFGDFAIGQILQIRLFDIGDSSQPGTVRNSTGYSLPGMRLAAI